MDKIIVSNLNRSEEVSSFGDRDASYIGSAVSALTKPGDVVIVEAQHRSLRDHYVKQILSLLFTAEPGVVVNRCKKDRDWMISAINQAFVKNRVNARTTSLAKLSEVWIADLNSREDFDLLRLAQTLVSQFEDAGVCLLVSCSPTMTDFPDFCRWSNRLGVPVWSFELPDASEMDAFLEREAETGAINAARKLVHELRSIEDEKPRKAAVADVYDFQQIRKEEDTDVMLSGKSVTHQRDFHQRFNLEDYQLEKGAEVIEDQPGINQPEESRLRLSLLPNKLRVWSRVKIVVFGLLILVTSLASVVVMFDDSVMTSVYQKTVDNYVNKAISYFSSVSAEEIAFSSQKDDEGDGLNLSHAESEKSAADAESLAAAESFVVSIEPPSETPVTPANFGDDKVDIVNQEGSVLGGNLEKESPDGLNDLLGMNLEPMASEYLTAGTNIVVKEDLKSPQYFAQLGAFGTENGAIWWQMSRYDSLPKTFVSRKSTGLWAVLSGPFESRELAKDTFSRIGVDVFVVESSDLVTK